MAQLRLRFIVRAREERIRLTEALESGDTALVKTLAHGLSGSAGVFGFPAISAEAAAVEDAIDEGADGEDLRRRCTMLLSTLDAACQVD